MKNIHYTMMPNRYYIQSDTEDNWMEAQEWQKKLFEDKQFLENRVFNSRITKVIYGKYTYVYGQLSSSEPPVIINLDTGRIRTVLKNPRELTSHTGAQIDSVLASNIVKFFL